MKLQLCSLVALLSTIMIVNEADARGGGARGGGGGARAGGGMSRAHSAPARPSRTVSRNPGTGSKVQRPASRPAAQPASRPQAKPSTRPAAKPAERPSSKPATRPSVERPSTKPATRPGGDSNRPGGATRPGGDNNRPGGATRPGGDNNRPGGDINRPGGDNNRPGGDNNRPGKNDDPLANRPNGNRPNTLPGMISYPDRAGNNNRGNIAGNDRNKINNIGGRGDDKINIGGRDNDRVNIGDRNNNRINTGDRVNIGGNNRIGNNTRINGGDRNYVHVDNVNVGRRNMGLNRPGSLPAASRNWNANQWGGRNSVWGNHVNIGNNVNINVNNNFRHSVNFGCRPGYWGGRPWWGAATCHPWHHGHWGYGYNSWWYRSHWYYDDHDFADGFMWGIAAWSLGNMVYNMGYQTYSNPYPAPPVENTTIIYTQPLSVSSAKAPPGDDTAANAASDKSDGALEASRAAFKKGDYVTAMSSVDKALAATPDDVTLHEYRALVLFALGRYADAAGVLNPVLASGPGWGWDTMIGFYDASTTYTDQLRKLEDYVKGKPQAAEGHFLLGYHYLVSSHMDQAYKEFESTAQLQPADSVARQLRDLTKSSLPDAGVAAEAPAPVRPPPVPVDKLTGVWTSDRGADGKVTFTMAADGSYTWLYAKGEQKTELKGTYGLNDKGLLVLTGDDSQMISEVTLEGDKAMKFALVGAPAGDPGLEFKKS